MKGSMSLNPAPVWCSIGSPHSSSGLKKMLNTVPLIRTLNQWVLQSGRPGSSHSMKLDPSTLSTNVVADYGWFTDSRGPFWLVEALREVSQSIIQFNVTCLIITFILVSRLSFSKSLLHSPYFLLIWQIICSSLEWGN